jgi:hypothetical protein
MVESAIFFPIAVFCAMAVLALLLNMYSQTATQAQLHVRLRAEAHAYGDRTAAVLTDAYTRDKYRREAESVSFAISETSSGLRKYLEASRSKTYYGGRFTNPAGYETEYFARSYILDEALAVRLKDAFVSGLTGSGR